VFAFGSRGGGNLRSRLGAAVDYLEAQLGEKVDLDEAARCCGLSRWHFMRVFQAASGLAVGEYVRLRRLSCAAEELAAGRAVLETALAWGYESQAAFTRAFSRAFAVPPAAYARKVRGGATPVDVLVPFEPRLPPEVEAVPPPTCAERGPFRVVGLAMRASVLDQRAATSVAGFWGEWFREQRWRPLGVPEGTQFLGLSALRASGELDYLIGAEVGPGVEVPRGYREVQVRGGRWDVYTCSGSPAVTARSLIFAAYGRIALDRAPDRRPGGWDLETFEADAGLPPGAMRCQHWVPLRPAASPPHDRAKS
jgi:AraC family transcriptional regulator